MNKQMTDGLLEAFRRLEAERDRYRAALEQIAKQEWNVIGLNEVAREALKGD